MLDVEFEVNVLMKQSATADVSVGSGQVSGDPPSIELTVLMPCLNEERTLGSCIDAAFDFLAHSGTSGEVLVADNGSSDGSVALALARGARVVHVAQRGYGAALRGGIEAARGRYVVMGDADGSYDFKALQPFLQRLRAGDHLVMGNRFRGGIAAGAMPWHHRWIGNPVLSGIGRVFFACAVGDFHCGLRGFERTAIRRLGLRSDGMEFASEMIVKATLADLFVTEVPTTLARDGRDRPPHLRSFRDGWRHLRFLLLHCPRWLFLYPALLLLLLGWGLQVAIAFGTVQIGRAGLGVHSMLYGAAMAMVGLQFAIYWVIGQYAAWRDGWLPRPPAAVAWIANQRLESLLLSGGGLFLLGLLWALGQALGWAGRGFGALQPEVVMRSAIPSLTLMVSGVEVAMGAFLLSLLAVRADGDTAESTPAS